MSNAHADPVAIADHEIDAERLGHAAEQAHGGSAGASAAHQAGEGCVRQASPLLQSPQAKSVQLAQEGYLSADGLTDLPVFIVSDVAVGVSFFGARHCVERGHLTAGAPAVRVRSGRSSHFYGLNPRFNKGIAA